MVSSAGLLDSCVIFADKDDKQKDGEGRDEAVFWYPM